MIYVKNLEGYLQECSKEEKDRIYTLFEKEQDFFNREEGYEILFYKKKDENKVLEYLNLKNTDGITEIYTDWLHDTFAKTDDINFGGIKISITDCIDNLEKRLNRRPNYLNERILENDDIMKESCMIIDEELRKIVHDKLHELENKAYELECSGFNFYY